MDLKNIPPEILGLILGQLAVLQDETCVDQYGEVMLTDLRNARLVCRQWNALASEHLFRAIPLLHNPQDETFASWNAAVDSEMVQKLARVAEIYSGPHHGRYTDMWKDRGFQVWNSWEAGEWKEFQQAISRLADLPNLHEVYICFYEMCEGFEHGQDPDHWASGQEKVEVRSTRLHTLRHVFRAMRQHKARYGTIRTLSIENWANHPLPELILSDDFQSFVKDITTLRLRVAEETNEDVEDWEYELNYIERQTFEPFLQNQFLPLFADQLTSLHLGFNQCWGTAPGTFDGSGLHFPNLKHLHLFQFAIAHDDHFDWVLRQTSLERLHLNQCGIASRLYLEDEKIQRWGVKTHDWRSNPPLSTEDWHEKPHAYDGTWAAVFDKIRTSLGQLVDFQIATCEDLCNPFVTPDPAPMYPDPNSCYAIGYRYLWFDGGMNIPWCNEGDRQLILDEDSDLEDRVQEREKGDINAWEELMQVIRERRARKIMR